MNASVSRLDVRPILALGRDPFREIMAVAAEVPAGGTLLVIAPFNPLPLRDVLGGKGFRSEALQTDAGIWEVTFVRAAQELASDDLLSPRTRDWSEGMDRHVDARGLEAASAVEAVLCAVGRLNTSERLIAHLDANIDRLYPELLGLGWEAAYVPGETGEVRLEISRAA